MSGTTFSTLMMETTLYIGWSEAPTSQASKMTLHFPVILRCRGEAKATLAKTGETNPPTQIVFSGVVS